MKRECAWCGGSLEDIENHADKTPITHGICDSCAKKLLSQPSESLHEFLDRLGIPVLLCDNKNNISAANSLASDILGKKLTIIETNRIGDVLECIYADNPEGCGNTVHCKSCTIRRTILETYSSGNNKERVKAYPDTQFGDKDKDLCFEISTEKVGEFVLLRIDDLREEEKES